MNLKRCNIKGEYLERGSTPVWIKNRCWLPNVSQRILLSKQRILWSLMSNEHPVYWYVMYIIILKSSYLQAHWHVLDSLQATRRDEMLSSALFMFPSMISTSLPHRRASYVSGVVRYILASLFCFFVSVMTLFQSPVSHDYIRSILRKFQISRYLQ